MTQWTFTYCAFTAQLCVFAQKAKANCTIFTVGSRANFDAHIKSEYRTVQLKAADTVEGVDWVKVMGVGGNSCLPYVIRW